MRAVRPRALITGASSGIGAIYADRLARRGYDLVLVARDLTRLSAVAELIDVDNSVAVELMRADLTERDELARVEERLREDDQIRLLVNNAGAVQHGRVVGADVEEIERIIRLNILALTRLTNAVLPRFVKVNDAAIVNIASIVALVPEVPLGVYSATKAYVLALSQSLQAELVQSGVYVQAVLPGATRTEIWERSGRNVDTLPAVMEVGEMVDAALVGFDRRERVTIPSLHEARLWDSFEESRKAISPSVMQSKSAARYRLVEA